ncbi:MAG: hypothetical protein KDD70_02845 [Bdellovibrionales bacterium]|nr:hypothetical protein [Bdellovibrionales bacterium]
MKERKIPTLNPRIREASEQYLNKANSEKQVRLRLLKQQLMKGTYQLNSTILAKSLVSTNQ